MNKFFMGLIFAVVALAAYNVFASAKPTKYASQNSDSQSVVIYGYTSSNVLTPVLVNSDGAVVTTTTP